ncbi:MAG: hypothetical protein IJS15_08690 [Victivallales bacterium]|nr:hypothetical protein [Victivallales bacterium]
MAASKDVLKRDDVRGLYPKHLNGRVAEALGRAACELLKDEGIMRPLVAVGHDCRHGNIEIAQGFMLGFMRAGGDCEYLGLVSTEHVYYSCGKTSTRYDAGAMVTASHNPKEYNGIKLIHKGCLPFGQEELAFIGARCDELLAIPQAFDFDEYAREIVKLAGFDTQGPAKRPFTVVVLAGGGMGAVAFGPIARILEPLGLHSVILEGDPDGEFPNGVPNPLLPDFMSRLSQKTLEHHADLGIGFDGDADRAGFVDSNGMQVIPSQVLALISSSKLETASMDKPIVMCNLCCSQLIQHLFKGKAEVVQTPAGHGRIKQLMRSEAFSGRTLLAGEHSGHYYYPEFNYSDSGVLSSLYMISLVWAMRDRGESLADKLAGWRESYCWSGEINYELPTSDDIGRAIVNVFESEKATDVRRLEVRFDETIGAQRVFVSEEDYDPARIAAPDLKMLHDAGESGWWFVLRPSGNEPKLRLNVEAWGPDARRVCAEKTAAVNNRILACGAIRK